MRKNLKNRKVEKRKGFFFRVAKSKKIKGQIWPIQFQKSQAFLKCFIYKFTQILSKQALQYTISFDIKKGQKMGAYGPII
jgi:hypothetical protein